MEHPPEPFETRADAGRRLAARLARLPLVAPVVYALPRGGVPAAAEIARALRAPLDLIFVRKIGAPGAPEVALGAVVDGEAAETVINETVRRGSGADATYFAHARVAELIELERRRSVYLGARRPVDPAGRTAIVVDDGLATGATMKAALTHLRRRKAAQVIVAIPVAPADTLHEIAELADRVECLHAPRAFTGVGAHYRDFHQLSDAETIGLLREVWQGENDGPAVATRAVVIPPFGLAGDLRVPADARGLVVFAHGSGSGRFSPRNREVAAVLERRGFATLLLDLLEPGEEADRRNVFDIPLLANRLVAVVGWAGAEPDIADLPLGLFGASTGAGAALLATAELGDRIGAVVSRGGRPDLAGKRLAEVQAPTLLIVGGEDRHVLELNRQALAALTCEKWLGVVPGAGHLFEEPGTLEAAADLAAAWFEHHLAAVAPLPPAVPAAARADGAPAILAALREALVPLPALEDPGFADAFETFGRRRVVLLGEASHGTSEFYRARAAITRRLIETHGFTIVAVEADWPDAAAIDRTIRGKATPPGLDRPFTRFPTWMWRNRDVDDFVSVLRRHNADRAAAGQVRFRGLDLYGMTASIAAVLSYLDRVDPQAAAEARVRYGCLMPWSHQPAAYGRTSIGRGYSLCEAPVTRMLVDLLHRRLPYSVRDGDDFFDAAQNARLIASAERYYRVMYLGAAESWNLRDRHMFDTLERLLEQGGKDARAVVWAHNSHIGDARFTEMGQERGELNIGQLCREKFGAEAALVGFGTHGGTVAAASDWDAPMEVKTVRSSRPGSYEDLCHTLGVDRFLLDLSRLEPEVRRALSEPRLERYIGVIYRPETERWSHYSRASLPGQYDAFVWFDATRAVVPLPERMSVGEEETYPTGL